MRQPKNVSAYHGMTETELQSAIYRLDSSRDELLAALRNLIGFIEYHGLTKKNLRFQHQVELAAQLVTRAEGR